MVAEKILVADDNLENVQFISEYLLRANGYVPLCAADGRQALDVALTADRGIG